MEELKEEIDYLYKYIKKLEDKIELIEKKLSMDNVFKPIITIDNNNYKFYKCPKCNKSCFAFDDPSCFIHKYNCPIRNYLPNENIED